MATETLIKVFSKFKLHLYHELFRIWKGREASLTTYETFCMEVIYCMDRPYVGKFADFAYLSSANAAEKVNSLISKGYIKKVQSEKDRRRYYLEPTKKYQDYHELYTDYIHRVMKRVEKSVDKADMDTFYNVLNVINQEIDNDSAGIENI